MAKQNNATDISNLIPSSMHGVGPVEVHQPNSEISWNRFDWPLYIKCRQSVDVQQLARVVQRGLLLDKPQILLSVLSDFGPLSSGLTIHEQVNELAIGLGKTASSARMWLATNGIDMGSSRMFATALNHARMWQSAVGTDSGLKSDATKFEHVCIGMTLNSSCFQFRQIRPTNSNSIQVWWAKID